MLLHHYCVNANISLGLTVGPRPEYGVFSLPKATFGFDFLLHAILALAALHLEFLQEEGEQESGDDFGAIAAGHINAALPSYKLALQDINATNCAALMMFSSMLSVYALAISTKGLELFRTQPESLASSADIPSMDLVSWLRLITGGMTAIRPWYTQILQHTEFGPCLNTELWTIKKKPQTTEQIQRDEILASLERLWTKDGDVANSDMDAVFFESPGLELSDQSKSALSKVLLELRNTYLWVTFISDAPSQSAHSPSEQGLVPIACAPRSPFPSFITSAPGSPMQSTVTRELPASQAPLLELGAIIKFLHTFDDTFLMLLSQNHHYALIIMAYYSVLLKQKEVWWMKNIGDDMIAWISHELVQRSQNSNGDINAKQSNPGREGRGIDVQMQEKAIHESNLLHIPNTEKGEAANDWLKLIDWPRKIFGYTSTSLSDAGSMDIDA